VKGSVTGVGNILFTSRTNSKSKMGVNLPNLVPFLAVLHLNEQLKYLQTFLLILTVVHKSVTM